MFKKLIRSLLTAILITTMSTAASAWSNLKLTYNPRSNHSMAVFEGKKQWGGLSLYGFHEAFSKKCNFDLQEFYGETRLNCSLNELVGVATEFNYGNDYEDALRIGISLTPKIGSYTYLKYFPFATNNTGQQISAYLSQDLTDKLNVNLLVDYNFVGRTYIEIGGQYHFIFVQARGGIENKNLEKMTLQPYIGAMINF